MLNDWYKDVAKDEKLRDERKQLVLLSRPLLEVLSKIMDRRIEELTQKQTELKEYDSPSWAMKQADYIGSMRTLNEVKNLLTIEKE